MLKNKKIDKSQPWLTVTETTFLSPLPTTYQKNYILRHMHGSISLQSFFSVFSGHINNSQAQAQVPLIRVQHPSDPQVIFHLSNAGVPVPKRWRGIDGYTLQIPNQGPTRVSRLALARQGCASGSFRLNCDESPFVIDERGKALFQRMDSERKQNELMEKPPPSKHPLPQQRPAPQTLRWDLPIDIQTLLAEKRSAQTYKSQQYSRPRKHRPDRRPPVSGMACSITITEGLCNLSEDPQKRQDGLAASFSFSAAGTVTLSALDSSIKWFDSLKRKQKNSRQRPVVLSRSQSFWNLESAKERKEVPCDSGQTTPKGSPKSKKRKANTSVPHTPQKAQKNLSRKLSSPTIIRRALFRGSDVDQRFESDDEQQHSSSSGDLVSIAAGILVATQQGTSML